MCGRDPCRRPAGGGKRVAVLGGQRGPPLRSDRHADVGATLGGRPRQIARQEPEQGRQNVVPASADRNATSIIMTTSRTVVVPSQSTSVRTSGQWGDGSNTGGDPRKATFIVVITSVMSARTPSQAGSPWQTQPQSEEGAQVSAGEHNPQSGSEKTRNWADGLIEPHSVAWL